MKAVLMSIQPKWCELIASGKKAVEVRKTKPKLETPFRVYIYCTKDNAFAEKTLRGFDANGKALYYKANKGKVIGEFVCDEITEYEGEFYDDETQEYIKKVIHTTDWDGYPEIDYSFIAENGEENSLCRSSCVSWEELRNYMGAGINAFFGWHIPDLVIYDKPRELSEFKRWVDRSKGQKYHEDMLCLQRPPQSWCYVEV